MLNYGRKKIALCETKKMEYNYIFLSLLGTDHLTCRGEVMVFCFVQNFFFEQHELEFIFFLSRKAQFFFFHNSTLGYMFKFVQIIHCTK
jgi:hypothetical protein